MGNIGIEGWLRVCRSVWNGQYLRLSPAFSSQLILSGEAYEIHPLLFLKTNGGKMISWIPDAEDMLAEDWELVII